jgi:hypothetical protein
MVVVDMEVEVEGVFAWFGIAWDGVSICVRSWKAWAISGCVLNVT